VAEYFAIILVSESLCLGENTGPPGDGLGGLHVIVGDKADAEAGRRLATGVVDEAGSVRAEAVPEREGGEEAEVEASFERVSELLVEVVTSIALL
jgi:hypothetical protein